MQTILITGASGNLGQSLAAQYSAAGDRVFGTGNPAVTLPGYTGQLINLTQEADANAWVSQVIDSCGTIDSAVLTVGGFAMGRIADTTLEMLNRQVKLNFDTAYTVARPVFLQFMKQGRGTLFFIGAEAGMQADKSAEVLAYGLAKSLLFRLAEIMNAEAVGTAVKVFVVVPHIIDTPQNRAAMPEADFSSWQTPGSIARLIQEVQANPQQYPSVVVC